MQTPFSVLINFCAQSLGAFTVHKCHYNSEDAATAEAEDGGYVCVVAVRDWEGRLAWAHGRPCRTKKAAKHSAADHMLRRHLMPGEDQPYDWPMRLLEFLRTYDEAAGANKKNMLFSAYDRQLRVWKVRVVIPSAGFSSAAHTGADLCTAGERLLQELEDEKRTGRVL